MYDLETIKSMNEKRCRSAKKENLEPFLIKNQDQIDGFDRFPFANIGDYRPKDCKLVKEYFVDSSGFGREGEGALSVREFIKVLKVGYGYAIIEEGQFQVYIGEFKKVLK